MRKTDFIKIYGKNGGIYTNSAHGNQFPLTDSCERSASIMNDDYVRLVFVLPERVVFDAFSYIVYDNQTFFLREQYIPNPNGTYYSYDMRFVSFANMLSKPICYRHVSINDGDVVEEWDEPEIVVNANLNTMVDVVIDSCKQAANRYVGTLFGTMLSTIAVGEIEQDTKLNTWSFSGTNISDVLTQIANFYEIEWWIDEDSSQSVTLNVKKCERGDVLMLSDEIVETNNPLQPYRTSGLASPAKYATEWSNVVQTIVPFGSERNITHKQAKDVTTQMMVSYNKRLRLKPNTTYVVNYEGQNVNVTTGAHGEVRNNNISTGIEQVMFYDDVYPQLHFIVTQVAKRGTEDNPKYDIWARGIKQNNDDIQHVYTEDELYTDEEMHELGVTPLREIIAEGETLSLSFESGYLNGMEFEVADKEQKQQGVMAWTLKLTIVPNGDKDEGTQIPNGHFAPRVGDKFALFNIVMPDDDAHPVNFLTSARNDLALEAYKTLVDIELTRPEVRCEADPHYFELYKSDGLMLGQLVKLTSDLFEGSTFQSRVISYSYKLTDIHKVTFSLASAHIEGRLTTIESKIVDQTSDIRQLESRAVAISRRGWRDAEERSEMINSLASEMMLVGNAKWQFAFTSSIECVNENNRFSYLRIGAGELQHTQDPYVSYANKGHWDISATSINKSQSNGAEHELLADTPYYVYAELRSDTNVASIVVTDSQYSNEIDTDTDFVLLGILSSEFPDNGTSYRVFNRTNGYSAIDGGTITTEQIQDANRNLIIDFQSIPPRIIARNGAEIIGNFKFRGSDEKSVEQQLQDIKWGKLKDLGQIVFDFEGEAVIKFGHDVGCSFVGYLQEGTYRIDAEGTDNDKCCVVFLRLNEDRPAYLDFETSNPIAAYCGIGQEITISEDCWCYIYDCPVSLVEAAIKDRGNSFSNYFSGDNYEYYIVLDNVSLFGNISQALDSYDYLKRALRDGSTEIEGGLVMTNVMMLKDLQGKVTAGMSGITSYPNGTATNSNENVLLWGGGTYEEALHASEDTGYDKGNGIPMTTLLKKDGTGKVGIFEIGTNDVTIKTENSITKIEEKDGITLYDMNNKPKVRIAPYHLPELDLVMGVTDYHDSLQGTHTLSKSQVVDLERYTWFTKTLCTIPSSQGDRLYVDTISVTASIVWESGYPMGSFPNGTQFDGCLYLQVGDTIGEWRFQYLSNAWIPSNPGFNVKFTIPMIIDLSQGDVPIIVSLKYKDTSPALIRNPISSVSVNVVNKECYSSMRPMTIIGTNGMHSLYNRHQYFSVINEENRQCIYMSGLPTDAMECSTGQLYNDNGVLKIKLPDA